MAAAAFAVASLGKVRVPVTPAWAGSCTCTPLATTPMGPAAPPETPGGHTGTPAAPAVASPTLTVGGIGGVALSSA